MFVYILKQLYLNQQTRDIQMLSDIISREVYYEFIWHVFFHAWSDVWNSVYGTFFRVPI